MKVDRALWFILFILYQIYFNVGQCEKKTYVIGVEDLQYFPLYSNDKGLYHGHGREVFDLFAKKNNLTFIYRPLPIKRLFNNFLNSDDLDFKYPDNKNWAFHLKKGKKLFYSGPIVEYIDGVMVKKDRLSKGTDSLKNLGTIRGFTPWDYLGFIKEGKVKISESDSFKALLLKTINNRVDGAYINIAVAKYQLNNILLKKEVLEFDKSLPHTRDSYSLSTRKYPKIIEKLNKFLQAHKTELEEIKKNFNIQLD